MIASSESELSRNGPWTVIWPPSRLAVQAHSNALPGAVRMQKPFYTTKPEGLGLGLSICREILAAHSSELRAERKDKGGLRFSFRLTRHPE